MLDAGLHDSPRKDCVDRFWKTAKPVVDSDQNAGDAPVLHLVHDPELGRSDKSTLGCVGDQNWSRTGEKRKAVLTTVEHFQRIHGRFWSNPEGAARKSIIPASLVVEYALHVRPPRSWD